MIPFQVIMHSTYEYKTKEHSTDMPFFESTTWIYFINCSGMNVDFTLHIDCMSSSAIC
jgi:hypothetical protein